MIHAIPSLCKLGTNKVQAFPVELYAVAGPVRGNGKAVLYEEGLIDVAIQSETMSLEIRAIGDGGKQMDSDVVRAMRSHREIIRFS